MGFLEIFQLPLWAHGLECEICQKTFKSAKAHFDYVKNISKHQNKIPVLRK